MRHDKGHDKGREMRHEKGRDKGREMRHDKGREMRRDKGREMRRDKGQSRTRSVQGAARDPRAFRVRSGEGIEPRPSPPGPVPAARPPQTTGTQTHPPPAGHAGYRCSLPRDAAQHPPPGCGPAARPRDIPSPRPCPTLAPRACPF